MDGGIDGTALKTPVVAKTSESIIPEVEYAVRSAVEVMIVRVVCTVGVVDSVPPWQQRHPVVDVSCFAVVPLHNTGDDVVVVANLGNRRWDSYNVGFPREGTWYLRFNSDYEGYAAEFTNVGYDTTAAAPGNQGMPASGNVGLGPYSVIVISQ